MSRILNKIMIFIKNIASIVIYNTKQLLLIQNTKTVNLDNLIKSLVVLSFVIWGLMLLNDARISHNVKKCINHIIDKKEAQAGYDSSYANKFNNVQDYCKAINK